MRRLDCLCALPCPLHLFCDGAATTSGAPEVFEPRQSKEGRPPSGSSFPLFLFSTFPLFLFSSFPLFLFSSFSSSPFVLFLFLFVFLVVCLCGLMRSLPSEADLKFRNGRGHDPCRATTPGRKFLGFGAIVRLVFFSVLFSFVLPCVSYVCRLGSTSVSPVRTIHVPWLAEDVECDPPPPHRVLHLFFSACRFSPQGGVTPPGCTFRFLKSKAGDSNSANGLGQMITFASWRSSAQ